MNPPPTFRVQFSQTLFRNFRHNNTTGPHKRLTHLEMAYERATT